MSAQTAILQAFLACGTLAAGELFGLWLWNRRQDRLAKARTTNRIGPKNWP